MRSNQAPTVRSPQWTTRCADNQYCTLPTQTSQLLKVLWQPSALARTLVHCLRGALAQTVSEEHRHKCFQVTTGVYSHQKADRSHRRSQLNCTHLHAVSERQSTPLRPYVSGKLECASDHQCSKSKDDLLRVTRQAGKKKRAVGGCFSHLVSDARRSHL